MQHKFFKFFQRVGKQFARSLAQRWGKWGEKLACLCPNVTKYAFKLL